MIKVSPKERTPLNQEEICWDQCQTESIQLFRYMLESLKEILVLFNCSCVFSFNPKYLYTIYTVYNDDLNYCWKARVFDTAACLLTRNLNIVVQCSKFSIETGIFN